MSLLKTMIKHTAGGQEARPDAEPHHYPPQQPQPAIYVSTGLDVHEVEDARDWPEDREIDGTLCRRLSPEYFAWLRSCTCSRPKPRTRPKAPEDAWNTLRKRFNALQALAIREFGKELPAGTALFFPEELSTTRASSRAPWRNPSKPYRKTGFIPGTKLGNVSSR